MRRTLPEPFLRRMKAALGEDYERYLDAMEREPVKGVWLQSGRLSEARLLAQSELKLEPIPSVAGGYFCGAEKPGNHPLHAAGAYYVQDPSAMVPVAAAPLRSGMKCLDLCAAPGGKSAQIRDRIGAEGFLVSNEIMPARCRILAENLERIGAVNTLISNADARRIAAWYPSFFDFILVDAPCSGEGMFRKDPESVAAWNENLPAHCAERQKQLVVEAVKALAPEGYLLYSTCTFSEEENENVVRFLLETEPSMTLCRFPDWVTDITAPGIGMPECRRFYPFLSPGEGQFMALLRKTGERRKQTEYGFSDARQFIRPNEMDAAVSFLEETVSGYGSLPLCGYRDHLIAADFPVPEANVYAPGVNVGQVAKGRLIPHHAMFKAFGDSFFRKWELPPSDRLLDGYLSGAELPCGMEDGWGVVTTLGASVGGVKIVGGQAKNHYPKGLRKPL